MDSENNSLSGYDNPFRKEDNTQPAEMPAQNEEPVAVATPPTNEGESLIGGSYNIKNQPQKTASRPSSGNAGAIVLAVFALLLGSVGLVLGGIAYMKSIDQGQPIATVDEEGYYTGNSVEFESTSVAAIVQKVNPAVVSIVSESSSSSSYRYSGSTVSSAGTGMIVSADGYIITNKHVVNNARNVQVITYGGDTYDNVQIVGQDPLNDVAYLKINGASDLPTITLGDSKTIAVGQPVLAIGNALGAYQNSVTQGIVSGTGRSIEASDSSGSLAESLSDMIQTDAAINPGNSGGPLVNANGDVIGINTAVADANGLGFSIPIAAVKGMLHNIMKNNSAERAYVGVSYLPITADVAKKYSLPVKRGAYVYTSSAYSAAVVPGGPAEKAGIKDGDIITKIGNAEVGVAGSISTLVGEYMVGDTIEVTYIREDKTYTTKLTLTAYSK